jgi:hypothetical protein
MIYLSTFCGCRSAVRALLLPLLGLIILPSAFNSAAISHAADTLINSFETGLDGFSNNGFGLTVAQDTIGATEGTHSLKVAMTGPTFVGAQTETLHPAFGDPPGLDYIKFDLTLPQKFADGVEPPGFAVIGVTLFAMTQSNEPVDLQTGPSLDPTLEFPIGSLEAGTYKDIIIDLNKFTSPFTGQPATFNELFGTPGSGPNDLILTGFQFYFNKTGGPAYSLTLYIDNIRVGTYPDLVEGDYNGNGIVDAADYTVWRDNLGLTGGATAAEGDGTGDGNVMQDDYDFWKSRFGNEAGSGGLAASVVPEPASGVVLLIAGVVWCGARRTTRRQGT